MLEGNTGSQPCTRHIADRHEQGQGVRDMICRNKDAQGRNIGGEVDQLGGGRGTQKIHADDAYKGKYQKRTGTRSKKPIVEPQDAA